MRTATILLPTLMLTSILTASAQNSTSLNPASSGGTTLTGCLKGSQHQYYLVDKKGHRHTLDEKSQDLSSYVNHEVTVTGKADTSRSPATSSDAEGHRAGYFSVDSVSDQGTCKK
jgi:hypothetical protein